MAVAEQRYRRRASDRDHGWRPVGPLAHRAVILGVARVLWLVFQLKTVILLLVLSIFFAYLIAPLVDLAGHPFILRGRPRRLSTGLSIGVVYLLLAAFSPSRWPGWFRGSAQQTSPDGAQAPAYLQAVQQRSGTRSRSASTGWASRRTPQAVEDALATLGRSAEEACAAPSSASSACSPTCRGSSSSRSSRSSC